MERNKTIQTIYARLARLEDRREELIVKDEDTSYIVQELKALRETLADIMNGVVNEENIDKDEECEHQDCDDHCCLDCGLENYEFMNMDPDIDMER
jgi:hypothetical protein